MKSQAIYLGKKVIDREEVIDPKTKEVVQSEFKGVQYSFYCSDWEEDEIESLGKTRTQTVSEKRKDEKDFLELPELEIGEKVTVQINEAFTNQNQYLCKLLRRGW